MSECSSEEALLFGAADGCEVGCPSVTDGTCTACSDSSTCSTLTCDANKFDINGGAADGCEVCPSITGATCNTCSDSYTCSTLTCDANKFDINGGVADGCEVGCAGVSHGRFHT